jgi:LMBR1 domain-containing protein 1
MKKQQMHPMKVNGTMMNSFLFNVGQMLLCSISCVQVREHIL